MKNQFSAIALVLVASMMATSVLAQVHDEHEEHQEHNHHADEKHQHDHGSIEHSDQHEPHHSEHGHDGDIVLSQEQINMAGIVIESIFPRKISYEVYAPSEITANGYTSFLISPRVNSVVIQRHVSLGEHVEKDQALVTLFSESVAQAQADYRIDKAEWERIRNLRTSTVSEKEKSEAQTRYVAAQANLKAFGLTDKAITDLTKDNSSPLGEYTLYAVKPGLVLNDDFQQGQRVEAGEALLTLIDEHDLWVEARLSPDLRLSIPQGSPARISVMGESYSASVIQEAHTINEITRTRIVRLLVNNDAHTLHSGMFADSYFEFDTQRPVMAVPESALVRSPDGHWNVFVEEESGVFVATEVERQRALGTWREISGIAEGTRVVTSGAFFVASEQAKSGFDPHNH